MDEEQCRKAIRAYYASTSFMDAEVGRVLTELKNLGLEKNTIVVFWADHGWSLGEHGQWEKQTLFESSAHVPLIFAGPGTGKKGQVCRRPVEHLDIYPTLADLCGLEGTPRDLQGASLVPLLKNPQARWDGAAISQVARPPAPEPETIGYSIRTERHRYTLWQGRVIGEELYDYEQDPLETRNLVDDPNVQALKGTLRERLLSITAKRGRSMELGKLTPASES